MSHPELRNNRYLTPFQATGSTTAIGYGSECIVSPTQMLGMMVVVQTDKPLHTHKHTQTILNPLLRPKKRGSVYKRCEQTGKGALCTNLVTYVVFRLSAQILLIRAR